MSFATVASVGVEPALGHMHGVVCEFGGVEEELEGGLVVEM